ncbi:hypothetical protein DSO57_1006971 [Entomophthora muscae]|uniref:Uncharacterized protein n=1 Tax=Entomophthora muscae TaxID=34485 RepID=A0ACC2TJ52_9FUNG|nr:hypothetical protein DSO57_1006971 [Entomophthora muscae]
MILLNALTCSLFLTLEAATYQPKKGEENCDGEFYPDEHRKLGEKFYTALDNVKTPDYAMFVRKYKEKCAYLVCNRCDHLGQLQSVGKDLWRNTWNDHCTKTWKQFWIGTCVCQLNILKGDLCPKEETDSEIEKRKKLESDKKIFNIGQSDPSTKSQSAQDTNKYLGGIKSVATKLNPFKKAENPEQVSYHNHIGKESKESSPFKNMFSFNNPKKLPPNQPILDDPSLKVSPSDVRKQNQPITDDSFPKTTPPVASKHIIDPKEEEPKKIPTAFSGAIGSLGNFFQKKTSNQNHLIQDNQEIRTPKLESKETPKTGNLYQPHDPSSTSMDNQNQNLDNQNMNKDKQSTTDDLFQKMSSSAVRKYSLEPKEKEEPKAKPSLISGAMGSLGKFFQKKTSNKKNLIQDNQETRTPKLESKETPKTGNLYQPHDPSSTSMDNQNQNLDNQNMNKDNQPTTDDLFQKKSSSAVRKYSLEPKEKEEEPKAKPSLISGAMGSLGNFFQKKTSNKKNLIQDIQETRTLNLESKETPKTRYLYQPQG